MVISYVSFPIFLIFDSSNQPNATESDAIRKRQRKKMGIKDLWNIFNPYCERKSLYELQGKRVAIDLSGWVCEAQNIAEYQVQPRMYLRNLFFRTCNLLLMEVDPVFVLEGRAPQLKYDTIAARNAHQFKGSKPKNDGDKVKAGKDRSRFNFTLKQCEEMLKLMGVACVKGEGEAEALCAYLNMNKLVDGIISQDSDCFAYGAQKVYKNFSVSQQGFHAAKGGSVEVFDISHIKNKLDFGRNKVIALALLCGSDYSDGVHGVGKDSALKFFNTVKDEEILEELRSWRTKTDHYNKLEENISNKNVCSTCGHSGKIQLHTRKGCLGCGTNQGCRETSYKEERLNIKNLLAIRSKALVDSDFPNETIIREFLDCKEQVNSLVLKWTKPNLEHFVKFTVKFLGWEEVYAFQKLLPMLTRWQLMNCNTTQDLTPLKIKKKRQPKGIPSYEIIWNDKNDKFENLIPKEQLPEDIDTLWSTIEPQELVSQAYPDMVDEFESRKKIKTKTKKKKTNPELQNIEDLMGAIDLETVKEKPKSTRPVNTLDNFVALNKNKTRPVNNLDNVVAVNNEAHNLNTTFDLDQSSFGDENDFNVSNIIERIVKRKIPAPKLEEVKTQNGFLNETSFFINGSVEYDAFEMTFNDSSTSIRSLE